MATAVAVGVSPDLLPPLAARRTPDHPPYAEMIQAAIRTLADARGSTAASIDDYIRAEYHDLPWGHRNLFPHYLRKLLLAGEVRHLPPDRFILSSSPDPPVASPLPDPPPPSLPSPPSKRRPGRPRKFLVAGKTPNTKPPAGKASRGRRKRWRRLKSSDGDSMPVEGTVMVSSGEPVAQKRRRGRPKNPGSALPKSSKEGGEPPVVLEWMEDKSLYVEVPAVLLSPQEPNATEAAVEIVKQDHHPGEAAGSSMPDSLIPELENGRGESAMPLVSKPHREPAVIAEVSVAMSREELAVTASAATAAAVAGLSPAINVGLPQTEEVSVSSANSESVVRADVPRRCNAGKKQSAGWGRGEQWNQVGFGSSPVGNDGHLPPCTREIAGMEELVCTSSSNGGLESASCSVTVGMSVDSLRGSQPDDSDVLQPLDGCGQSLSDISGPGHRITRARGRSSVGFHLPVLSGYGGSLLMPKRSGRGRGRKLKVGDALHSHGAIGTVERGSDEALTGIETKKDDLLNPLEPVSELSLPIPQLTDIADDHGGIVALEAKEVVVEVLSANQEANCKPPETITELPTHLLEETFVTGGNGKIPASETVATESMVECKLSKLVEEVPIHRQEQNNVAHNFCGISPSEMNDTESAAGHAISSEMLENDCKRREPATTPKLPTDVPKIADIAIGKCIVLALETRSPVSVKRGVRSKKHKLLDSVGKGVDSKEQRAPISWRKDVHSRKQNLSDSRMEDSGSNKHTCPESVGKDVSSENQNPQNYEMDDVGIDKKKDTESMGKDVRRKKQNFADHRREDVGIDKQKDPESMGKDVSGKKQKLPDPGREDASINQRRDPESVEKDVGNKKQKLPTSGMEGGGTNKQKDPESVEKDASSKRQNFQDSGKEDVGTDTNKDPEFVEKGVGSEMRKLPDYGTEDLDNNKMNDPESVGRDVSSRKRKAQWKSPEHRPEPPKLRPRLSK